MGLMAQVDRARSTLQSANEQLSEARELLGLPKQEAPKEPEEKGFFDKLKDNLSDIGHTVLDVAGLVPIIGAPADGLNGVWYAAEGDWVNAGLSAAGIIPFVGEAAVAAKLGSKGIDAVRGADNAIDAANTARTVVRPADSPFYEVGFEAQLQRGVHYPGLSEQRHFQEANRQLHETMQADEGFANAMEELYPGIKEGIEPGARGAFPRKPPTQDVSWHHEANREGVVQLIPRSQHQAPGPIQESLHPNGRGGMKNWGGGRSR